MIVPVVGRVTSRLVKAAADLVEEDAVGIELAQDVAERLRPVFTDAGRAGAEHEHRVTGIVDGKPCCIAHHQAGRVTVSRRLVADGNDVRVEVGTQTF